MRPATGPWALSGCPPLPPCGGSLSVSSLLSRACERSESSCRGTRRRSSRASVAARRRSPDHSTTAHVQGGAQEPRRSGPAWRRGAPFPSASVRHRHGHSGRRQALWLRPVHGYHARGHFVSSRPHPAARRATRWANSCSLFKKHWSEPLTVAGGWQSEQSLQSVVRV